DVGGASGGDVAILAQPAGWALREVQPHRCDEPLVAILAQPVGWALPWMTRVYRRELSAAERVSQIVEGRACVMLGILRCGA
ncbi:MAG: hypothetical protein ACRDTA_00090, partial [Pseudonocardiaceae bacterium]